MIRVAAAIALAAGLGGCVETVKFRPLAPTDANIERALSAERSLTHPQTQAVRADSGERLSLCLKGEDGHREMMAVRRDGDQVCGTLIGPREEGERQVCYALDSIETVGLPRDATTIGYYPVRGWLKCRGDT